MIVNSDLSNHMHVNRFAEVIETPSHYKGEIKKGDTLVVHHNVFRIYYDMKGRPRKSPNYFKGDVYIIDPYQFYLYHDGNKWHSVDNYCFVKPMELENKYLPIDEMHITEAINPYGLTKFIVEEILSDLVKHDNTWSINSLRYFP